MVHLTKDEVEGLIKISKIGSVCFGNFELFVASFGTNMDVQIVLDTDSRELSDRTIELVNDVANLTNEHYELTLRLLFDDAMRLRDEISYTGPSPPPEQPPANWLRRIFWRPSKYRFDDLSHNDPAHPLFGIESPHDIEARIKWEGVSINDSQETPKRIAFLLCSTPWDVEHGREVAICDGVPIAANMTELNEYYYMPDELI